MALFKHWKTIRRKAQKWSSICHNEKRSRTASFPTRGGVLTITLNLPIAGRVST